LDRRALLQGVGALVVTSAVACGRAAAQEPTPQETEAPETAAAESVSADAVQGFLAIDPGGQVTIYAGKVDLGTGVERTHVALEGCSASPTRSDCRAIRISRLARRSPSPVLPDYIIGR
jgi:hypothetical protein